MSLHNLIAQGGRNIASPVERYLQQKKENQAEQMNRLSMLSTRQSMDINAQKQQMLQQEQSNKGMAAAADYLDTIQDPEEKKSALQQLIPQFQQKFGIPNPPPNMQPEQIYTQLKQKQMLVNGTPEGKPVNVMYQGRLQNAIVNSQGNYVDEKTRKPLYGAVKAPTRQERGDIGTVTAGSGSNRFKLNDERRKVEEITIKTIKGNNEIAKLADDPNWVGGTAGDVIGVVNSISQQISNLSGVKPKSYSEISIENDVSPKNRKEFSALRKKAMAGDRYAAAKIEMTYMNAKRVDPGSKITDKDFSFADKMLGSGGDKEIIKQILKDNNARAISAYNDGEKLTYERNKGWYKPMLLTDERQQEFFGEQQKEPKPAQQSGEAPFDPDAWLKAAESQ